MSASNEHKKVASLVTYKFILFSFVQEDFVSYTYGETVHISPFLHTDLDLSHYSNGHVWWTKQLTDKQEQIKLKNVFLVMVILLDDAVILKISIF